METDDNNHPTCLLRHSETRASGATRVRCSIDDSKGDGLRAVLLAVGGVAAVDLQRMLGCSGGCVPSPLPPPALSRPDYRTSRRSSGKPLLMCCSAMGPLADAHM